MNALARFTLSSRPLFTTLVPRALATTSTGVSYRSLSIGSDLAKKEKVEEDRYIRQKEHEAYLARKAKEDAENAARELTAAEVAAKEEHDAVTSALFGILSKTGDKVSDECIENLADWKLGK